MLIGLNDALGNALYRFDVVHYGARAGQGSANRTVVVLGKTAGGFIRGVSRRMRFQRYDEDLKPVYGFDLDETTIRIPEQVVKVHPDYWNDNIRQAVKEAKEQYGGKHDD